MDQSSAFTRELSKSSSGEKNYPQKFILKPSSTTSFYKNNSFCDIFNLNTLNKQDCSELVSWCRIKFSVWTRWTMSNRLTSNWFKRTFNLFIEELLMNMAILYWYVCVCLCVCFQVAVWQEQCLTRPWRSPHSSPAVDTPSWSTVWSTGSAHCWVRSADVKTLQEVLKTFISVFKRVPQMYQKV